jgi:signal transduction histidine kinase/ActR/RegA family two-component response regulator
MPHGDPARILYIEDDPGLARLFQRRLESAGYRVDVAGDGDEGLRLYDRHPHDIVVVDQRLPAYDGLEVIRLLASRGPLPPTIMVTAHGNERIAVEAMKLGANDYVVKDAEANYLELLPSVIEQLLFHRQVAQEREQALAELQKRNLDLASLNDVGQVLASTLDLNQIVERLLPAVTSMAAAEGAALWLIDEEEPTRLRCQTMYHLGLFSAPAGMALRLGQDIVGRAARDGTIAVAPSLANDPHFLPQVHLPAGFLKVAMVALPMRVRDNTIGVLEIINPLVEAPGEDDVALVETVATSAAIAIDNARLVEALRQRTDDLQARNEELDAFAHTVAHDLKNPLSQAIGFATILSKDFEDIPPDELRQYLHFIALSTQKMENIINELLLLAGVRKTEVERKPLEMATIVGEALQRLAYLIEQNQAEIAVPDNWPAALGHGPWVEEVWANFLSNAVRYGGKPPRVELGADTTDGQVRFWVRDNGEGLAPEDQAKLFTPFTQLSQVQTQGHGLGLSIVRRIVEKLGGQVGVESEVGAGSLFYFSLPAAGGER